MGLQALIMCSYTVCRGLLGKEDMREMGRTVPTKQMKNTEIAEERQKGQWTDRGTAESWRKVIPPAALVLALCPKLESILCQRGAEPWISRDRATLNTSSRQTPRGRNMHFLPMCWNCLPPFHHFFCLWDYLVQHVYRIYIKSVHSAFGLSMWT